MSAADKANRELARLDAERVRRTIDVATFRAERRRVLLDYEERQSETTPSTAAPRNSSAASDSRMVRQPDAAVNADRSAKRRTGLILAFGVVIVLVIAGAMWSRTPKGEPQGPVEAPVQAEPANLPQEAATKLIDSEWSAADIDEFLRRWNQFSPQLIQSTTDDSRIWLLRGETETRLRNARDALSLGTAGEAESSEASERIRQLEAVQKVIRAP